MNFFSSIIRSYRRYKLAYLYGKVVHYEELCASLQTQYNDVQKLFDKHLSLSAHDSSNYQNPTGVFWISKNFDKIVSEIDSLQYSIAETKGKHAYWNERYNQFKKLCGDE